MNSKKLIAKALLHPVAEDSLVLDDATLLAAIEGRVLLNREQKKQLLHSPLTLRRFRLLTNLRRAQTHWQGSEMQLRAAAGEGELPHLDSEDGRFTLHFIAGRGGKINMVLSCKSDPELAQQLQQAEQAIEVVDSEETVLLEGALDESYELAGSWLLAEPPRAHFMRLGTAIVIRPQKG